MVPPAPVSVGERIETLDVIRGFALLGILAMNIRAMAAPFGTYMYPYAMFDFTGVNRAAYILTSVVFDLKMMGLFSMLFGVGALLYAAKAPENSKPARALWFKRMFWLLVIGLLHAYFIWDGDILVPYALCGLLLLWWVRRFSAGALMAFAVALLAIGAALTIGHGISWERMAETDRAREAAVMMPTAEQAAQQLAVMQGSYLEIVRNRTSFVVMAQTVFFAAFFFWRCGGMMLLGMALFKWRFLDGRRDSRTYGVVAATCIPLGLLLAWYGTVALERVRFAMPQRAVADLWNYTGAVFASVGYAALIILAVKRGFLPGLRVRLAAVGQMAFSNYLFQSVITAIVFLGWGFGLAGRVNYAGQLLVVVAIWAVQLGFSRLWLESYRFGPAEWLWRSLTYGKLQPFRRITSAAAVGA